MRHRLQLAAAFAMAGSIAALASAVENLTQETFYKFVDKQELVLTEFYFSASPRCVGLFPVYEEVRITCLSHRRFHRILLITIK